jgi:hypothetical protein
VRPRCLLGSWLGAAIGLSLTVQIHDTDADATTGVPDRYQGRWVCQTARPGYNLVPPHADPSRPASSTLITPPTVAVHTFTLRADGTYEASNVKGTYAFDPATTTVRWLGGPHQGALTKTELGQRENGAPKIGFVLNRRYYGCFLPKPAPRP